MKLFFLEYFCLLCFMSINYFFEGFEGLQLLSVFIEFFLKVLLKAFEGFQYSSIFVEAFNLMYSDVYEALQ